MPVTRRCFGQLFRLFCYCVLLALGTGEASSLTVMRKQTTLTDGADDVDRGDVTVTGHELVGEREDREQVHGRQEPSGDSEKLERRLPRALIIGVKKAGTRALLEFLRLHPDVRATGPETHFFDRHYNKGIEWYRLQMPLTLPGQITMEKTPSYFVTEEVPARIRSTLPEARLLVVVRDPVTRALSDYAQTASKRPDTTLPFEVLAFRRRRRRRDLDSTSTSRRRRNRSRNYTSSGARRPIAPEPSTDKTPAAFHYSMLEKAAKLFTGKLYGSEDSQLRHLTFRKDETYNKRDIEGREGTVSNRQPAHSEDRNYLPHRQVDNKMYTFLNVTKADDPLKRAQLENKGSWENYIPRGDTYIRIKNKGASSSSKGTDEDKKRVNEEDIEHTVSNGECGTVGHSANNSKCSNTSGDVDESWSGIRIGLYASHLAHWLSHFPQSQIHVVSGEELVRNPAREMAMVQDFLGLRRLVSEDHFYFNRTKGFPCLKKSEGSGSPHCLGKTKGRTHPRLSEESERRLRKFFEPHNRDFYKIVGRDFDWERAR